MKVIKKKAAGLASLVAAAVLSSAVAVAPAAHATASQDAQYVACVSDGGLYHGSGPATAAAYGRGIATDISNGVSPLAERTWVYQHTPYNITLTDANVLVNCATSVWLGFGSDGTSSTSAV